MYAVLAKLGVDDEVAFSIFHTKKQLEDEIEFMTREDDIPLQVPSKPIDEQTLDEMRHGLEGIDVPYILVFETPAISSIHKGSIITSKIATETINKLKPLKRK
jgi:hypothetical protein